jgi:hypothetical protein
MRLPEWRLVAMCLSALSIVGCDGTPESERAPAAETAAQAAAAAGTPNTAAAGTVTLPTSHPERPFVRVEFDKLQWRPTEGNTLGVETAVVEGDPSKTGFYLTINHFPAGVMSRFMRHPKGGPHYDGALGEDTWVAISGYGATKATVIDGGELFGRSR